MTYPRGSDISALDPLAKEARLQWARALLARCGEVWVFDHPMLPRDRREAWILGRLDFLGTAPVAQVADIATGRRHANIW
jgi:hypothetical protein